jgi:TRAP-type C4-dicarboxylate transport system substrate-binding protein
MKRRVVAILSIVLLVSAAVFAQGEKESAADKVYEIKLTSNDSTSTIWMEKMQAACDDIREQTEGKVDIQIYGNGEMLVGDEGTEALMSDAAVFCFQDPSNYGDYIPEFNTLCAPYLWSSHEDVEAFSRTDEMDGLLAKAESANIHTVGNSFFVVGIRNILAEKPVSSLDDLKKVTLRVPNNSIYIGTFKALGSSYQGMSMADTFNALETGMVEGCENTTGNFVNNHIDDSMKTPYLSLSRHMVCIVSLSCGQGYWETLPEAYRQIVDETFADYIMQSNMEVADSEQDNLRQLQERGVEIVEIEDLAPFRNAVQEYNKTLADYDEFRQIVESL